MSLNKEGMNAFVSLHDAFTLFVEELSVLTLPVLFNQTYMIYI